MSKKLDLYLIVTGTHLSRKYGSTVNEIKKDGFKIFATIDMIPREDTNYFMSEAVGKGVIAFSKIFKKIKPHINLVLGDRDEMLASTIAAYHMNIPNVHVHGGDKSGGIDEYNRHAITKMSNIHFAATKKSMERIIRMGENPKYVFRTGSPSVDEIKNNKITNKIDLEVKYGIRFSGNEILLLQHPVTTQSGKSEQQIRNTLEAIVRTKHTVIAISPNSDPENKKIVDQLKLYSTKYKFIKMYTTLPRCDFLGMLKNCGVLLGNSSSGMIEASYFHIPVVNVGIRQQNRERGKNVINVTNENTNDIYLAIIKALRKKREKKLVFDNTYGNGDASTKIIQHLEKIPLGNTLIQKQISY